MISALGLVKHNTSDASSTLVWGAVPTNTLNVDVPMQGTIGLSVLMTVNVIVLDPGPNLWDTTPSTMSAPVDTSPSPQSMVTEAKSGSGPSQVTSNAMSTESVLAAEQNRNRVG